MSAAFCCVDVVSKFTKYVSELEWNEAPDYNKVRKMFLDGLKLEGVKLDAPLCFTKPMEPQNGISKAKKGIALFPWNPLCYILTCLIFLCISSFFVPVYRSIFSP
jgi:hypothetical protein